MGLIINNVIDNNIIAMDWIDGLRVMPKSNSYKSPYLNLDFEDTFMNVHLKLKFFRDLEHNASTPTITFEKLLEKLYASFKNINPIHMNFKILCDSLDDGRISKVIKKTILEEYINNDTGIDVLYVNVISKIIMFTDFTLICPNGDKILCLKSTLKTIPYFKLIIEDTQIDNEMTIDIDRNLMNTIMEIVNGRYNAIGPDNYINTLGPDNYINTLVLMDKYLMIHHFPIMVEHGMKNMHNYLDGLLKINAFDKIKTLYQIFKNILDSPMEKFEFVFHEQFYTNNKLKRDIKCLMRLVCERNMGNQIITFDGWQQHFPTNQKLKYVASSKNYELLHTINVDPILIIAFMAHIDFSNNIYCDILNANIDVFLGSDKYKPIKESKIIVHTYYPILSYSKIMEIPIIIMSMGDCVTIKLKQTNITIPIGARILFAGEVYSITKITKCNGTFKVDVNIAQYISSQFCDNIYYNLYFDNLHYNDIELFNTQMFLVENVKHDIKI